MVQNDSKLSTIVVTTQNYQSAETTLTICPTHHTYPGSDQRRYVFPNAFEGHDSDHTEWWRPPANQIKLKVLRVYEKTWCKNATPIIHSVTQYSVNNSSLWTVTAHRILKNSHGAYVVLNVSMHQTKIGWFWLNHFWELQGGSENGATDSWPSFCQTLTDSTKNFTGRFLGKFAVKQILKIPPQGKQGWASSWTDPPSPRPPWWVFWLVRPHKVSYKVSYLAYVATLPCETLMSAKQDINDKLQSNVSTYLRCGGVVHNQINEGL